MKFFLAFILLSVAAAEVSAGQLKTCPDPGIAGFYKRAASTGQLAARQDLGTAIFAAVQCLATGGGTLPKSHLRGPYAVAVGYLAFTKKVDISMVSDDEIDAMARRLPKGKGVKKNCGRGCYD